MYRVRQQIGCDDSFVLQVTEKAVGVGVLDTGISNHPDFYNRIVAFRDFVNHKGIIYDDCGHGTHVAGCIGGDGRASKGKFKGVHPKCNLIVGKVLNAQGEGNLEDMIKGFEWMLENAEKYNLCVINISVGVTETMDKQLFEEMLELVEEAWERNIMVVCAAGNTGPKPMTVSPLGAGKHVISVGCHDGGYFGDREDVCEKYSGRGPSKYVIKKPDLVAPGTDIVSCNSQCVLKNGRIYREPYVKKSGTSMATPIVTGAVALLYHKCGRLECEEIKRRVIYSAVDLKEPWTKQGWGMLNVKRMLTIV